MEFFFLLYCSGSFFVYCTFFKEVRQINSDERNRTFINFLLDEFLKNYIYDFIDNQITYLNSEHIIAKNKLNEQMKKFENGINNDSKFKDKTLDEKITSLINDLNKKSNELTLSMKKKNFIETHDNFYNEVIALILLGEKPQLNEVNSDERSAIIDNLISSSINKYFIDSNEFKNSLKEDRTEFDQAFQYCYYVDTNENGEDEYREGDFTDEEIQAVIDEYYTNTSLFKREVYPPRCLKAIYVINDIDDCQYLFQNLKEAIISENEEDDEKNMNNDNANVEIKANLVDKVMTQFFKPMHVQEIKKHMLKGESVIFGYFDIFDVDVSEVYKLPEEWRTKDLKFKGYFIINNLNERLIAMEDSIIDEVREREELDTVDTEADVEKKTEAHQLAVLDDKDKKNIIGHVTKAVVEYDSVLARRNSKYAVTDYIKSTNKVDSEPENTILNKPEFKDVIYLKDRIVCQITPQMVYLSMNEKIVLGVKTYDVFTENGEKYIYAKDHYYSKYRVVRHGESHRYSISRETASLDELMEFFDVTELNRNTVDESVDEDIEGENQIHLAGTDNDYEVFFDDIRDPSEEYEDDDEEDDEYAEDEYYQNDYSKSEISINIGEDDYDDEEY